LHNESRLVFWWAWQPGPWPIDTYRKEGPDRGFASCFSPWRYPHSYNFGWCQFVGARVVCRVGRQGLRLGDEVRHRNCMVAEEAARECGRPSDCQRDMVERCPFFAMVVSHGGGAGCRSMG
jgi:hypothetical protein